MSDVNNITKDLLGEMHAVVDDDEKHAVVIDDEKNAVVIDDDDDAMDDDDDDDEKHAVVDDDEKNAVVIDDDDDDAMDDDDDDDDDFIEPFAKFASDPLVKTHEHTLDLLKALHRNEEGFMFDNRAGDLKYMFRSAAECDDAMMVFEIVVPYDVADDPTGEVAHLFNNEYTCDCDDAGDFVFDTMTLPVDATIDHAGLKDIVEMLNYYYNLSICECGANVVKTDDLDVCFSCQLRRQAECLTQSCTICGDSIITTTGRVVMNCCGQPFHKKCVQLWRRTSKAGCPICRK